MKKKWWLAGWGMAVVALLLNAASMYQSDLKTLHNEADGVEPLRGKVILVVNIASRCVYTPQLGGLEKLYDTYRSKGFTVLGIPTNQTAFQEPLDDEELEQFCKHKYGITFPIFGKIDRYGMNASPLEYYVKSKTVGWNKGNVSEWNFTKYLIGRNGLILRKYSPRVTPEEIASDIEKLL